MVNKGKVGQNRAQVRQVKKTIDKPIKKVLYSRVVGPKSRIILQIITDKSLYDRRGISNNNKKKLTKSKQFYYVKEVRVWAKFHT
jgi:hypothetical protein